MGVIEVEKILVSYQSCWKYHIQEFGLHMIKKQMFYILTLRSQAMRMIQSSQVMTS